MSTADNYALMRIPRRAEQSDTVLSETFVNAGSLTDLLAGVDHQVMYGRRGTGKTHALRYLGKIVQQRGDTAIYIDLRTIGSNSSIYNDPATPLVERGSRLLVDVLQTMHDALTTVVLQADESATDLDFTQAMRQLDLLGQAITEVRIEGDVSRQASQRGTSTADHGVSLGVTLSSSPSANLGIETSTLRTSDHASVIDESGPIRLHIQFGSVQAALAGVVSALPARRVWILLDEWPAIPVDLQPLLADMLKRCLFPIAGLTVKIAAIERASRFRAEQPDGTFIGLELGSDAIANVDLDQFLVFQNDPTAAKSFFLELLFRHVSAGLSAEDRSADVPASAASFLSRAFTQEGAFEELVKSAEGVPRDAINVAALAAQATPNGRLSTRTITDAARRWYLQDKEASATVSEEAKRLLTYISDEVIGERRARAFLLEQDDANDPLIALLYRERVLHVIKRGIATYVEPGVRYDVYQIDYGAYVHLRNTNRAVRGLFELDEDDGGGYADVPADDYRSIRRAVLKLEDYRAGRQRSRPRLPQPRRPRDRSAPTLGLETT